MLHKIKHNGVTYRFAECGTLRYLRAVLGCSRPQFLAPFTDESLSAQGARCFLAWGPSRQWLACGFYLTPDGEVGGLVNATDIKGLGRAAFLAAQALGAKRLNCFDGFLTRLYRAEGWRITHREPFNPSLAPRGWDVGRDGRPDVVTMVNPR